jgi:hypothetical protein
MTDIPYLTELRENLVTGIGQRQRRIARRVRAALVLVPAALIGVVVATSLPGGSSPAFAIERDGDRIEVRIADAAASEAQMESELQAAGIDADIILAPTTAEYVGQWACITGQFHLVKDPNRQSDGPPQMPDLRSQFQVTPEVLYLQPDFIFTGGSSDYTGGAWDRLVLVIGRAPEPGEQPLAWPEVCGDGIRVVSEE